MQYHISNKILCWWLTEDGGGAGVLAAGLVALPCCERLEELQEGNGDGDEEHRHAGGSVVGAGVGLGEGQWKLSLRCR